jgi:hypothetical protein
MVQADKPMFQSQSEKLAAVQRLPPKIGICQDFVPPDIIIIGQVVEEPHLGIQIWLLFYLDSYIGASCKYKWKIAPPRRIPENLAHGLFQKLDRDLHSMLMNFYFFYFFYFFPYFYRQRKINVLYINTRLFQVTCVILDNAIFYGGRKLQVMIPGSNSNKNVHNFL